MVKLLGVKSINKKDMKTILQKFDKITKYVITPQINFNGNIS